MADDEQRDEERSPTRWRVISGLGYALVTVVVAVLAAGYQGNRSTIAELEGDVEALQATVARLVTGLEADLEAEVARLDESNRNRRNSIAELEVATAANLALLDELRRDVERLLPPGAD